MTKAAIYCRVSIDGQERGVAVHGAGLFREGELKRGVAPLT